MLAILGAIVLALSPLAPPATVAAQPCIRTAITQFDMTGVYREDNGYFLLYVYPCGGAYLVYWDDFGQRFDAFYGTTERLDGGGYIAKIPPEAGPFARGPWGTDSIGYKPAERGAVQVMWVILPFDFRVRHAWKISNTP